MSRVLIKSAWGSDDPTKAAFPFLHANAFVEAGHEVQIFLPASPRLLPSLL
jgi:predicted peroxiredoxin